MVDFGVAGRIKEFDAMHGASVYDGAWIYYEDGAMREGNPMGAMMDPPADARKRHQNIVRYHQIQLDREVREFDGLKKTLQENPGTHPNEDENLKRLRRIRNRVKQTQGRLRDAQAELKKLIPGYRTPEEEEEYMQQMAATATAKHNYLSAVDAIKI